MNKRVYPVVLTRENGVILIEVPDMEILTQGKDIYNSIEMARDAIGIKGISMEDAGEEIPLPSPISAIRLNNLAIKEDNSIVTLIAIDFEEYREGNRLKAVKPELYSNGCDRDGNEIADEWLCPRCLRLYEVEYDKYNYCPNCGQKIDRTEIEKLCD